LGDPQVLSKLDKDYFASVRGTIGSAGGNLPFEPYQKIETLNPKNPKLLSAGKSAESRLTIGEDFTKVGPVSLLLRFRFDSPLDPALVEAAVNDQPVKLAAASGDWLQCVLEPTDIRPGVNRIRLTLSNDASQNVNWSDLLLEVRHR
jgi:hypothetical protein